MPFTLDPIANPGAAAQGERNRSITGGTLFPYCKLQFERAADPNDLIGTLQRRGIGQTISLASAGYAPAGDTSPDMDVTVAGEFGAEPQTCTILLRNLSEDTKNFITRYTRVNIELGYRDGEGNGVFSGYITRRENLRDGPDDILELHGFDDSWVRLTQRVSHTFENVDAAGIVYTLARAMGVPIGTIELTGAIVPKYVTGAKSILDDIREITRDYVVPVKGTWKFHVRQGAVNYMSADTGYSTAVLLSPDTGLKHSAYIGTEFDDDAWQNADRAELALNIKGQVVDGRPSEKLALVERGFTMRNVNFDSLMQPSVLADSIVKLESFRATGVYRVKTYKHHFATGVVATTSGTLTPLSQAALL